MATPFGGEDELVAVVAGGVDDQPGADEGGDVEAVAGPPRVAADRDLLPAGGDGLFADVTPGRAAAPPRR